MAWPEMLARQLHGAADLAVRDAGGQVLARARAAASARTSAGGAELVDRNGNPLAVDGAGRLVRTFEDKDRAELEPLLDAVTERARRPGRGRRRGVPGVRHLAGRGAQRHSSSVTTTTPTSPTSAGHGAGRRDPRVLPIQRALAAGGLRDQPLQRGGDQGRRAHLGRGDRTRCLRWVLPPGQPRPDGGDLHARSSRPGSSRSAPSTLEGRTLPAPAEPERLLEAMYGPSWRVPDPTFVFETPARSGTDSTRGSAARASTATTGTGATPTSPTVARLAAARYQLTRMLHRREAEGTHGPRCGLRARPGRRVAGRKGHRAVGLDFAGNGFAKLARVAAERGLDADVLAAQPVGDSGTSSPLAPGWRWSRARERSWPGTSSTRPPARTRRAVPA